MSRTVRSYNYENGREGLRLEKGLKRDDGYVGYSDEGIWNRKAKKCNKRTVNKHNRHIRNNEVENQYE